MAKRRDRNGNKIDKVLLFEIIDTDFPEVWKAYDAKIDVLDRKALRGPKMSNEELNDMLESLERFKTGDYDPGSPPYYNCDDCEIRVYWSELKLDEDGRMIYECPDCGGPLG